MTFGPSEMFFTAVESVFEGLDALFTAVEIRGRRLEQVRVRTGIGQEQGEFRVVLAPD